jgi:aminomethyltransferase
MDIPSKRTPLASIHESLGARMIDFGGWWMPVQYQGIMEEHRAVRTQAGLFDISHMGEIFVTGSGAESWLNRMLTNDVSRLADGEGQYTLLLNERGGVIDDLLCYRLEAGHYLLLVNASKIEEDFVWLHSHASTDVQVNDQSSLWAGLALQGPNAAAVLEALLGPDLALPARNRIDSLAIPNGPVLLARTGYTGEDGFEWFCPAQTAPIWWDKLMEAGRPHGLVPCGLGARDTLRLEAGFSLNGADLSPGHTPLEAGLSTFVKMDKGEFIGRSALAAQQAAGPARRLVALVMEGKTPPPRPHYPIFNGDAPVGETTSGTLSPTLAQGIALAYLPSALCAPGTRVEVEIRGRRFPALVSKRPFYRRQPAV